MKPAPMSPLPFRASYHARSPSSLPIPSQPPTSHPPVIPLHVHCSVQMALAVAVLEPMYLAHRHVRCGARLTRRMNQ